MATIERTTSGMVNPTSSEIKSQVQALKTSFAAGNVVEASHINSLLSIWRSFNDHYHTTSDLYGINDYGNISGGYSGAGNYDTDPENTSGVNDASDPEDVAVGDVITATKYQEIRSAILVANGHTHSIDDRTA
jgi:hypothetical protein